MQVSSFLLLVNVKFDATVKFDLIDKIWGCGLVGCGQGPLPFRKARLGSREQLQPNPGLRDSRLSLHISSPASPGLKRGRRSCQPL